MGRGKNTIEKVNIPNKKIDPLLLNGVNLSYENGEKRRVCEVGHNLRVSPPRTQKRGEKRGHVYGEY